MHELTRSLAWFRPESALAIGLLLVVLVYTMGGAWRAIVTRALTLASLAAALGSTVERPGRSRGRA